MNTDNDASEADQQDLFRNRINFIKKLLLDSGLTVSNEQVSQYYMMYFESTKSW